MALTDFDKQLLLIMQVGDVDPYTADPIMPITPGSSGIVLQNVERLWASHILRESLHPFLGPEIFSNYFKRGAVQLIIGVLESRVDFSAVGTALTVKLNQRIQARQMQADRYTKEIIRLEGKLTSLAAPVAGLIQRVEPITPPAPGDRDNPLAEVGGGNIFTLDANAARIQGSPYWNSGRWPWGIR